MRQPIVRPVHADEWERVRDLRLRAVRDPAASVAFIDTAAWSAAQPDAFWQDRAAGAAEEAGDTATIRQFVAVAEDGRWLGSATGILQAPKGESGPEGEGAPSDDGAQQDDGPTARTCLVVGVYLEPAARGAGLLGWLFDAVDEWATAHATTELRLTVHRANPTARRAYEKLGFAPTGHTFTGSIGPELELRRVR